MVQAKTAALVDIGDASRALTQHEHRLVDHRQQDAVDDEARLVLGLHDLLVQAFGKGAGAGNCVGTGGQARDHLDQAHDRHRIEEMQADEALGIGRTGRHAGNRNRAGVGCHDRVFAQHLAGRFEDLALDFLTLGRGLDDEVRFGHRRVIADRGDAGNGRSGFVRGDLAAANQPAKRRIDPGLGLFRHGQIDVGQQDLHAELGNRLGNAGTHLPRANNRYCPHVPLLRTCSKGRCLAGKSGTGQRFCARAQRFWPGTHRTSPLPAALIARAWTNRKSDSRLI